MDMKNEDFFNLLSRIQGDRLDEQRCTLPLPMEKTSTDNVESVTKSPDSKEPIEEVLLAGRPYPLVVLPVNGDYWQEGTNHVCQFDKRGKHVIKPIDAGDLVIEDDISHCCYKNFFQGQEHLNFAGECSLQGQLLLSIKFEENSVGSDEDGREIVRVILRSADRTIQSAMSCKDLSPCPGPREIVKNLQSDLDDFGELHFHPIIYPKASALIKRYDEHGHAEKFKVGVIYQKAHQTHEGQYFSNKSHSKAMHDFLHILGDEVELFGFQGYSGGLDIKKNQTGRKSIYTNFKGREIMFHVSTLLPFTTGDSQQLQRKRHIGNDIIAIVFQDENTPFCPSSVRSSFLHIFFVVQVEEPYSKNTRYKITVTAKEDVPEFGPDIPNPAVFSKNDPLLREFLLTKLLNAELAALKAKQFAMLMERTRKLLFEDLVSTLVKRSQEMLMPSTDSVVSGRDRGRLLSSLRNAFKSEIERSPEGVYRSRSLENLVDKSDEETYKRKKKRSHSHTKRHSFAMDVTRKPFRHKPKGLFHGQQLNVRITDNGKNSDKKWGLNPGASPVRSRSLTATSSAPNSPNMSKDLPREFAPSNIIKNLALLNVVDTESSQTLSPVTKEATLQQKRPNGMTASPRLKEKEIQFANSELTSSPLLRRKSFTSSSEEGPSPSPRRDTKEDENSLVATLRGDLYKLNREKQRLQRENEDLREDARAIKEAMSKQAEDLCNSQYQLTLIRGITKSKGQLTSSVV